MVWGATQEQRQHSRGRQIGVFQGVFLHCVKKGMGHVLIHCVKKGMGQVFSSTASRDAFAATFCSLADCTCV